MAAAPGKAAAATCNYVAQDKIWKDHVHQEMATAKTWPNSWGFLTTNYHDLVKDDFPDRKKPSANVNSLLAVPPVTPIEKYIKVDPSPQPIPKSTAKQIGWRSGVSELALEKYGKYAKPKGGLVRQLNWPTEAI